MLGSNFIYKDKKVSIELTSVFNYLINNDFVKYGGNYVANLELYLGKIKQQLTEQPSQKVVFMLKFFKERKLAI